MPKTEPVRIRQGYAAAEPIRAASSSGGVATALALSFLRGGGTVCSCKSRQGGFSFAVARTVEEWQGFAGSKYVKSDPRGIYTRIREMLADGERVLFIGLPCQAAGLRNLIGANDALYIVDLICHGTPAPSLLSLFLKENGMAPQQTDALAFRTKNRFHVKWQDRPIKDERIWDRYTYLFLKGTDYTNNCYHCPYAQLARVSDLTLGDAWGSALNEEEREKGLSLILIQNPKGEQLLSNAEVRLFDIDESAAIAQNAQLRRPSVKPKRRKLFFGILKATRRFGFSAWAAHPVVFLKQDIKEVLFRLRNRK